jgi:hypothetical protein
MEQGEHTMSSYRQAAGRAVLAGALALGGALVLGGAKPAAAAVPITSCNALITTAGNFVLVNDLACAQIAISIQADNVRLDLGEHTITGIRIGIHDPERGVQVFSTGVHVVGGTITGFKNGIVAGGADIHISGVTVSNSRAVGLLLSGCSDCEFVDSQVSGNSTNAFQVTGPWRISKNTITGNLGDGILVAVGGVQLTKNVVTDNGTVAIGTVDLRDNTSGSPPDCANIWHDNTFATTAGDGAACIQ